MNPYKYFNKASQMILNSLHEKYKKEDKEFQEHRNCPNSYGYENMTDEELEEAMYNHDCKQEKCQICAEYANRKGRNIDLEVDTAIEQSRKL